VAGVAVWWWLSSQSSQSQGQNWKTLDLASEIGTVVEQAFEVDEKGNPKWDRPLRTPQAKVARAQIGWYLLHERGIRELLDNPRVALMWVTKAKSIYSELADEVGDDQMLGAESLYAVAVAEEALAAGQRPSIEEELGLKGGKKRRDDRVVIEQQLESAKQAYQQVVDKYEKSAFGKDAAERVKALTRGSGNFDQIVGFYLNLSQEVSRQRDVQDFWQKLQETQKKQGLPKQP